MDNNEKSEQVGGYGDGIYEIAAPGGEPEGGSFGSDIGTEFDIGAEPDASAAGFGGESLGVDDGFSDSGLSGTDGIDGGVSSKPFSIKLFGVEFGVKRLVIAAAIVALCAVTGLVSGSFVISGMKAAETARKEAAAAKPAYTPPPMPYNFYDSMSAVLDKGAVADRRAANTEPAPIPTPTNTPSPMSYNFRSSMRTMFENRGTADVKANSSALARPGRVTVDGAQEGLVYTDDASTQVSSDMLDTSVTSDTPNTPDQTVLSNAAPDSVGLPDNPTVDAPQNPFPTTVISAVYTGDTLASGRAEMRNDSEFTVENAYIEVTLNYYSLGETKTLYAYAGGVNIEPGQSGEISFAVIPPIKSETRYRVDTVSLSAFDSHDAGGESVKVFYDRDNAFLEVLAEDVY